MTSSLRRFCLCLVLSAFMVPHLSGPAYSQESEEDLTPNAHFMSGKLYLDQAPKDPKPEELYEEAEGQFRMAVAKDTANAEYRAWWAVSLAHVGKEKLNSTSRIGDGAQRVEAIRAVAPFLQKAGEQFSQAIQMDPKKQRETCTDNRLHFWVEIYKQADGLFKDKNYEDALEFYKLLTVLDPNEPEGHFRVAYTMDRLGQARESVVLAGQAKAMAEQRIAELGDCKQFKSTKLQSSCRKKIKELGDIIGNVDRFTRSKYADLGYDALDAALAEKNDAARKLTLLDEAQLFFEKTLEQDSSRTEVRFNLGNVHFNRAMAYEEKADTANGYPAFRKAAAIFTELALDDSVDADTHKDAIYNAGQALYASNSWIGAHPMLLQYIDLEPKEADTYRRVAKCLAELDRHAEAVSYLMMANALSKGEPLNIEESVTTMRNLHPGSDQEKSLTELGNPEEARSYREPESGRVIVTWVWWTKGEARHYLEGALVGKVRFSSIAQ